MNPHSTEGDIRLATNKLMKRCLSSLVITGMKKHKKRNPSETPLDTHHNWLTLKTGFYRVWEGTRNIWDSPASMDSLGSFL